MAPKPVTMPSSIAMMEFSPGTLSTALSDHNFVARNETMCLQAGCSGKEEPSHTNEELLLLTTTLLVVLLDFSRAQPIQVPYLTQPSRLRPFNTCIT